MVVFLGSHIKLLDGSPRLLFDVAELVLNVHNPVTKVSFPNRRKVKVFSKQFSLGGLLSSDLFVGFLQKLELVGHQLDLAFELLFGHLEAGCLL